MVGNGFTIQFLGAAATVTGSKYLLNFQGRKILVDCGLFQGLKDLRLKNWEPFPVDPKTIDAVVLTHAHIDHSGYIPRLIREGFRGPVYCTAGTKALCEILLPDTGYLQEEEAEFLNRRKLSKHQPALPLFSQADAEKSLKAFRVVEFGQDFEPAAGMRCCFLYAGHILGAATLVVRAGTRTLGFSGDVGRPNDPVFFPPSVFPRLDYLVVESTYGDRMHPAADPMAELGEVIRQTSRRGGVVLIPAFTVGRAQTILHFLARLKAAGRIPDVPMYMNSPMATHVTDAFCHLRTLHKMSDTDCKAIKSVVRFVETAEESKALNEKRGPMVIISASGMATGGRILHHLKAFASDRNNSIVLTGFQAAGTRGQAIQAGVETIKVHGQLIPLRAQVFNLDNLSAHSDYKELLDWLGKAHLQLKKVFVTHGELSAARAMSVHLADRFGWNCEIPEYLSVAALE